MRRPIRRRRPVTEAPAPHVEVAAPTPRRALRRRQRFPPITRAAPPTPERLTPRVEAPPPPVAPPPVVTPFFTSQINPAYPVHGTPTTQSVRDNFQFAKQEIEALYDQTAGGIPNDAPNDGRAYGRQSSAWSQVIASNNDVVDGGSF